MRCALLIALLAAPIAAADGREAVYGIWGTAKQCARAPIIAGGSVPAAPFEIGPEWLRHGAIWCKLTWFPVERRANGIFTGARAQCGEDGVRDYLLRMRLTHDALTLRWSFTTSNGPLSRCSGDAASP